MRDGRVLAVFHRSVFCADVCREGWSVGSAYGRAPLVDQQLGEEWLASSRSPASRDRTRINSDIVKNASHSACPWGRAQAGVCAVRRVPDEIERARTSTKRV